MYQLNIVLFINLAIMCIMFLFASQIGTRTWLHNNADMHHYLYNEKKDYPINIELFVIEAVGSFYLIFNLLIPLDLAVNTILIKMVYTLFVEVDAAFIDEEKSIE